MCFIQDNFVLVSIASDALLLLATSPIKKTPNIFSTSQIPGFLHPPVEISSLLKSFISNDSLHQSNFNIPSEVQSNGSESEKNKDKIEHTSQLPSYSHTRTQGNINSVDTESHLVMVQELNNGDQLSLKKNGHRSKANRPIRPKVVPCDYNFVPKQATSFCLYNKARHKTKNNEFDCKSKELSFASSVSNLLSLEKAILDCPSSSMPADTINVAPHKNYDGDNRFSNDADNFLRSCQSGENNDSDQKNLVCTNNADPNRCKQNSVTEVSKIIEINQEIPIITLKKENINVSKNNTTVNITPEKVIYNDKTSNFTVYDPPKGLSSSKDSFADRFKKIQAKHLTVKQNVASSASNSQELDTHITNKSEVNKLSIDKSPSQSYVVSTNKSPSPPFERKLLTSPIQGCMYRIQGNTISPLHPSSNEPGYFSESNVCDIQSFVSISPVIPYNQPSKHIRPAHKAASSRRNKKMSSDEKLASQTFVNDSFINIDTTPKKNNLTSPQNPEQKHSIKKEIKVRFNFKSPKKTKVEKWSSRSKAKFKPDKPVPSNDLTNQLFLRKKMLFNTAAKSDTKPYNQVIDFYDCSKKSTKLLQVSRSIQVESPDLSFLVDPAFQDIVASCNDQLEIILEPLKSFHLSSNMPLCVDQTSIPTKEKVCNLSSLVLKTEKESSYREENSNNTANLDRQIINNFLGNSSKHIENLEIVPKSKVKTDKKAINDMMKEESHHALKVKQQTLLNDSEVSKNLAVGSIKSKLESNIEKDFPHSGKGENVTYHSPTSVNLNCISSLMNSSDTFTDEIVVSSEQLSILCDTIVVSNEQSSTLSETIVVSSEQSNILCSTLVVSNGQSNFLCNESVVLNEQPETIVCSTEQLELTTGEIVEVPVGQLNTVYNTTLLEIIAQDDADKNNSKLVNQLENKEGINTKSVIKNIECVTANTESEVTFKAPNLHEKTAKRPFLSDAVCNSLLKNIFITIFTFFYF